MQVYSAAVQPISYTIKSRMQFYSNGGSHNHE